MLLKSSIDFFGYGRSLYRERHSDAITCLILSDLLLEMLSFKQKSFQPN